jgi:two-component system, OmpR family, response regulator
MEKSEKLKIFLVDDDKYFSKSLKQSLMNFRKDHWEVELFPNGEECIQNLHHNPKVVILDYSLNSNLPDAQNGIEILKKIKKQNNKIDIVLLSSNDKANLALNAVKHGACNYLVKEKSSYLQIIKMIYFLERKAGLSQFNNQRKWVFRSISAGIVLGLVLLYFFSRA